MNLQEFTRAAIVEIIAGVAAAREDAEQFDAVVGSDTVFGYTKEAKILTDGRGRTVSLIEFDIALAEASAKDTKGVSESSSGQLASGRRARRTGSARRTPESSFPYRWFFLVAVARRSGNA